MSKKIMIFSLLIFLVMPIVCFGQSVKKTTPKVSFDYIDADVRNVMRSLTEISGKNIVISEAVKGKITMKLDDVYWDEAMDIVVSTSGLKKVETDNIIKVMTVKEYDDERKSKDAERDVFRKERIERQKLGEEFITETIYLNYTTPPDVEKMLRASGAGSTGTVGGGKGFLSEFGTITQVPWNNALIIKDTKENIANIVSIVKEHDRKPNQIQIDCKIVQASSSFSKQLGIQWGMSYSTSNSKMLGNKAVEITGSRTGSGSEAIGTRGATSPIGTTTTTVPYSINLPAAAGAGSGGVLGMFIGGANDSTLLDIQLSALEAEGKGRIISNPKVVTSDNKKAIIQQGKLIPYPTTSSSAGTQTNFAEAVLGLEVTPTVTSDGYIKLDILAKKDAADFSSPSVGGVPTIDKKQASTLLYIRDGETAVIGGIYERDESDTENGLPGLRNIPLLGWLFKKSAKSDSKTELLIFITPRILKNLYRDEG
jgi:type IV pilus assembly protein PilQ